MMMMKMMTDLSHQKQDHCIGSQIRQVAQLAMPQSLSEEQGQGSKGMRQLWKTVQQDSKEGKGPRGQNVQKDSKRELTALCCQLIIVKFDKEFYLSAFCYYSLAYKNYL